ncbi:MAG: hypothetical protein ACFB51_01865 [Anaerolineae bacterium]
MWKTWSGAAAVAVVLLGWHLLGIGLVDLFALLEPDWLAGEQMAVAFVLTGQAITLAAYLKLTNWYHMPLPPLLVLVAVWGMIGLTENEYTAGWVSIATGLIAWPVLLFVIRRGARLPLGRALIVLAGWVLPVLFVSTVFDLSFDSFDALSLGLPPGVYRIWLHGIPFPTAGTGVTLAGAVFVYLMGMVVMASQLSTCRWGEQPRGTPHSPVGLWRLLAAFLFADTRRGDPFIRRLVDRFQPARRILPRSSRELTLVLVGPLGLVLCCASAILVVAEEFAPGGVAAFTVLFTTLGLFGTGVLGPAMAASMAARLALQEVRTQEFELLRLTAIDPVVPLWGVLRGMFVRLRLLRIAHGLLMIPLLAAVFAEWMSYPLGTFEPALLILALLIPVGLLGMQVLAPALAINLTWRWRAQAVAPLSAVGMGLVLIASLVALAIVLAGTGEFIDFFWMLLLFTVLPYLAAAELLDEAVYWFDYVPE